MSNDPSSGALYFANRRIADLKAEIEQLRGENGAQLSLLREIRRAVERDGLPHLSALGSELYRELCSATDESTGDS